MAASGRFGKYGDLKRKKQIRSTRVSRSGSAKRAVAVAGAERKERFGVKNQEKQRILWNQRVPTKKEES